MSIKHLKILLFSLLLLMPMYLGLSTTNGQYNEYKIIGNGIEINNSNAFISAKPHILRSNGYVEFTVESKKYEGDVNVIFGFNTTIARPKTAEFLKLTTNITKSYTCSPPNTYTYTTNPKHLYCYFPNSTLLWEGDFEWYDLNIYTVYWKADETIWEDIQNKFDTINYELNGKNKWYYMKNVPIQKNKEYKIRSYIKISKESHGKYDFAIYPSSYGSDIKQAHQDGKFYYLDPWWNNTDDMILHYKFEENVGASYVANDVNSSWSGNVSGTMTFEVDGYIDNAVNMTKGHIHNKSFIDRNDFTDGETVCFWIKFNAIPTTTKPATVYSSGETGSYGVERMKVGESNDGQMLWQVGNGSGGQKILGGYPFSVQKWVHICGGIKEDDEIVLWINGTRVNSAIFVSRGVHADKKLYIGATPTGTQLTNATIDDFRIYDIMLTDAQVSEVHNSTLPPSIKAIFSFRLSDKTTLLNMTNETTFIFGCRNSTPTQSMLGMLYCDSTLNKLRYYNNTAWVNMGELSGGTTTYTGGANISLAGNIISINKSFEYINNCSIDNSCGLIHYDSELRVMTNTSLLNSSNITCVREDTGYKCYYNGSIGAGSSYTADEGNLTLVGTVFHLLKVDLAELNNSVSAFITTAVSTLTNYFTKTDTDKHYWNESDDIDDDEIAEAKIGFSTACASGEYYRLTGNDLECTTPTDTFNTTAEIWDAIENQTWDNKISTLNGTVRWNVTATNKLTPADATSGVEVQKNLTVGGNLTIGNPASIQVLDIYSNGTHIIIYSLASHPIFFKNATIPVYIQNLTAPSGQTCTVKVDDTGRLYKDSCG